MWKKALAGISALVLVTIAFFGAVFAQAENTVRASEKIGDKIADYKVAHPGWTKRLTTPIQVLFWGHIAAFVASGVYGYFTPNAVTTAVVFTSVTACAGTYGLAFDAGGAVGGIIHTAIDAITDDEATQ